MKKIIFLVLGIGCFSSFLAAEPFNRSPGIYTGGSFAACFFLGGGLDGEEYYSNGYDLLIPVYKPSPAGFGWGIIVGYQNSQGLGMELGVQQSYHSANWIDIDGSWSGSAGTVTMRHSLTRFFSWILNSHFFLNCGFNPL